VRVSVVWPRGGALQLAKDLGTLTDRVAGEGDDTVFRLGGTEEPLDFVSLQDERAVDSIDEFGMVGRPYEAREGVESPVQLHRDDDAEEDGEDGAAEVGHSF